MWVTTLVWAITSHQNGLPNAGIDIGRSGIVDERRFYVTNMGNENPVTAADYLDYPRMRAMVEEIDEHRTDGGVILPSFNYDEWYVAQLPGGQMPAGTKRQVTVYFLNLGMTSMNAPLDVRVIDQMGLGYPLAAHTERLEDGRIGHDKVLQSEWVVAESGAFPRKPVLPGYLDEDTVQQAQVALTCPETVKRFESYEGPWTFARFKSNLKRSFEFSSYRINRNTEYELQRCGLPVPPRINPR
jgi:arabinofuranosyltransferase